MACRSCSWRRGGRRYYDVAPGRACSRLGNARVRSLACRPPLCRSEKGGTTPPRSRARGIVGGHRLVGLSAWLAQATMMVGWIALVAGAAITFAAVAMTLAGVFL